MVLREDACRLPAPMPYYSIHPHSRIRTNESGLARTRVSGCVRVCREERDRMRKYVNAEGIEDANNNVRGRGWKKAREFCVFFWRKGNEKKFNDSVCVRVSVK
jgi:hypothetical protein